MPLAIFHLRPFAFAGLVFAASLNWARAEFVSSIFESPADVAAREPVPAGLFLQRLPELPVLVPASETETESLAAPESHTPVPHEEFTHACQTEHAGLQWEALARAFYLNNHRVEFTGQEATFGVEGAVRGSYTHWWGEVEQTVTGEFFLNQPFDRNILVDTAERRSYRGNFEIDPFDIKQLNVSARYENFLVSFGKMPTPFGRTYFPLVTNDFHDAPFIRTESILWRETGVLLQFDPSWLVLTAAITNGGPDQDTNSSKAAIARAGIDGGWFACGASVKEQDGIGSESQKTYKSHAGLDAMLRGGPWTLSSEVIYDTYGLRRPFDPNNITWGRSIYYRDLNFVNGEPTYGVGYYADLTYQGECWTWMFNYGEFYPQQKGVPQHDVTTRRGIAKTIFHFNEHVDAYGMALLENNLANAQDGRERRGWEMLFGFQYSL